MRRTRRLLGVAAASALLVLGLGACDTDSTTYHCGLVIQKVLIPFGHGADTKYDQHRTGDWDFCYFRGAGDHRHVFYININDHQILGG